MNGILDWRNADGRPVCNKKEKGFVTNPFELQEREEITIVTDDHSHICSCRFGAPRKRLRDSMLTWSGDSFRYDIFRKDGPFGCMALRWQNGSGCGWLVSPDQSKGEDPILRMIPEVKDEGKRWDLCHTYYNTVTRTALTAALAERERMLAAHCEGRLKVRRCHKERRWYIVENNDDRTVTETYL